MSALWIPHLQNLENRNQPDITPVTHMNDGNERFIGLSTTAVAMKSVRESASLSSTLREADCTVSLLTPQRFVVKLPEGEVGGAAILPEGNKAPTQH